MEYIKKAHSVFLLTYHVVFVTKYRKPVISDEIGDFLKNQAAYLCEGEGCELVSAETDKDHIHMLISMTPETKPSKLINLLKGSMAREVRKYYNNEISKHLYGDRVGFWSPSYFIVTTGSTSMDVVKKYIEQQRTDKHKRKYVKSGKYKKY